MILNGTNKGKIVDFSNEYTYTGMLKQKYHKGDKVLLNGSESNVGSSIQSVKRDTELVVLLGLLIFALMTIAGKKGVLTIITVGINIVIFSVGFLKSGDDADVVAICNKWYFLCNCYIDRIKWTSQENMGGLIVNTMYTGNDHGNI